MSSSQRLPQNALTGFSVFQLKTGFRLGVGFIVWLGFFASLLVFENVFASLFLRNRFLFQQILLVFAEKMRNPDLTLLDQRPESLGVSFL